MHCSISDPVKNRLPTPYTRLRAVLAAKVAITLEICHAVEVLHEAFTRHDRLEMVNPDQGRQFNAQAFVHAVKEQGCQFSMDKRGAWTSTCRMKRMP